MMNHGQLNWGTIWPQGQKTEWYAYSADTQINRRYHGLSCSYRGAGAKTSTAHYNEGRPKSHCFEKKVSTVRDMDIKLDDGNVKPCSPSLPEFGFHSGGLCWTHMHSQLLAIFQSITPAVHASVNFPPDWLTPAVLSTIKSQNTG